MAWRGSPSRYSKPLCVGLALLGGVWFFVVPQVATAVIQAQLPRLRQQLAQTLQADVEFRTAYCHGWRGLVLEEVRLSPGSPLAHGTPIRIGAVELPLRLRLWPRPTIELRQIVLRRPEIVAQGDPESIRLLVRALQLRPQLLVEQPIPVWLRPTSLRVSQGRLTILTPAHPLGPGAALRFDEVKAVLTEAWWFIPAHFTVDGVLGAEPESRLIIQGAIHQRRGATTRVDLTIRGRQFNVARINPYLEEVVHFPEGSVDGVVKIWITPDGRLASLGRIKGRDLDTAQPGLWGRLLQLVSPLVSYELKGRWAPDRLQADEVVVKTAGLRFRGQGEVRLEQTQTRYNAQIASGNIPTRMLKWLFPELEFKSGELDLRIAIEGTQDRLVPHFIFVTEDSTLVDPVHRVTISKVDGTLDVTQERVLIDRLDAFINDVPIRLHLDVAAGAVPAQVACTVETYPQQLTALRKTNPWVVQASVHGQYQASQFIGTVEGKLSTAVPGQTEARQVIFAVPAITVQLPTALTWEALQTQGVSLTTPEITVRPERPGVAAPGLSIQRVAARATLGQNQLLVQQFGCRACDGDVEGKATVDATTVPGTWEVTVRIHRLRLAELWQGLGSEPPPITGELAFDGRVTQSRAGLQIRGWTQALHGQVQQLAALTSLAQETGIEPLNTLTFRELSATFHYADNVVTVEPFVLEGEQARLRSTCRIGTDGHLAGELAAEFPQEAVRASSRLRWLMRFVGADPWIDFDFKLGGSLKSLRIQWLPGEFKKRIQDKLSPGLLQMLDAEMNKMMKGP